MDKNNFDNVVKTKDVSFETLAEIILENMEIQGKFSRKNKTDVEIKNVLKIIAYTAEFISEFTTVN